MDKALETNLPYIEHYKRLQLMNESPNKCLENHKNIFKDKWTSNFERSVEDILFESLNHKSYIKILTIKEKANMPLWNSADQHKLKLPNL